MEKDQRDPIPQRQYREAVCGICGSKLKLYFGERFNAHKTKVGTKCKGSGCTPPETDARPQKHRAANLAAEGSLESREVPSGNGLGGCDDPLPQSDQGQEPV